MNEIRNLSLHVLEGKCYNQSTMPMLSAHQLCRLLILLKLLAGSFFKQWWMHNCICEINFYAICSEYIFGWVKANYTMLYCNRVNMIWVYLKYFSLLGLLSAFTRNKFVWLRGVWHFSLWLRQLFMCPLMPYILLFLF